MDYSKYTAEDFAADEDFIAWVKSPTEELNSFWNAWLSQNLHRKAELERGRRIVLALEIKENHPPEGAMLKVWANINNATRLYAPSEREPLRSNRGGLIRARYAIAATLVMAMIAGAYLFIRSINQEVVIATHYGESRTVILPDSTRITLNGNSSVRYLRSGFEGGTRDVWLDGEAFFTVTRTLNNDQFVVHTSELSVKVLGTRFNVRSRRGNTEVVLDEGKVKLDMAGVDSSLVMKPGELVEFSEVGTLVRKPVDPDDYSSWRNNRLVFKSATLEEIARILEDTYGFVVILEDEHLKKKSFTGSSSSDNIHELLDKLGQIFDLEVVKNDNQIIMREKVVK